MKKRVSELINKYQKRLLLDSWEFSFEVASQHDDGENAAATIAINHIYKTGHITVYRVAFERPNNIESIIAHEMCHCLTEPLYIYCHEFLNGKFRTSQDINEQRELLTEWISRLVK